MWPFSKKSIDINRLAGLAGWLGYNTSTGAVVSEATALQISAVFCAVRVISEGIAQIPVRVVRETYDGDKVSRSVARTHWAHNLLANKPNAWQTSFEFREYAIFCAVLANGFLAVKNTRPDGAITELLPVPYDSWSVRQDYDYSLEYTVTYADRSTGIFTPDQVMHLRGPSRDGYKGMSAVRLAREAIGLTGGLEKQQSRVSGAGGKPSGVLSFTAPLSADAKDKLRETWQQRFGPQGDGGIAVLDGDTKFHPITMTAVDSQLIETRKHQVEEIARAFRVQPIMLMQADKASTFASAEQMFRMHVIHTLMPWMRRFEETCNRDILSSKPGLKVDLDERQLLRGDFKDQAEYYARALGSGGAPAWMTQNDVRTETGLNPVDDPEADRLPSRPGDEPRGEADGV